MTCTWSACATCKGLLDLIEWSDTTHPDCSHNADEQSAADYIDAVTRGDDAAAARHGAALDQLDTTNRTRRLGPTALFYARQGWPVFPLRAGDKTPATRNGLHDATVDETAIRQWWTAMPQANIGLVTGVAFDVLDIDFVDKKGVPSGAHELWPLLRDSGKLPDIHGVATTPRGGLHVLLAPRGDGNLAGRWSGLAFPGLDYRGIGGYIVGAGSRTPGKRPGEVRTWSWTVRPSPRICGLPDWPAGLDDHLTVAAPTAPVVPPEPPPPGGPWETWRLSGETVLAPSRRRP